MTVPPSQRVRAADADDATEIIRLARLLWEDMDLSVAGGDWEDRAREFFVEGLRAGSLNAFVADSPDEPGRLIACGIGLVYSVMPAFWLPTGRMGYLQWFSTERPWRGRGLGAEILRCLLEWFAREQVTRLQLHASGDAERLYRRHGFVDTAYANLWLRR